MKSDIQLIKENLLMDIAILPKLKLYEHISHLIANQAKKTTSTIALTGGSTPKDYYKWVIETGRFNTADLANLTWTVSDERCVPLLSDDSNFGHADRLMLAPLGIEPSRKLPWPVDQEAIQGIQNWNKQWSHDKAFDLCFLGMGEDGHTASIFPGSPLLQQPTQDRFVAIEVPGKGWRYTITPCGLSKCGQIVVIVTGANKAAVIKDVLQGNDFKYPVQLLKTLKTPVLWLLDEAAGSLFN